MWCSPLDHAWHTMMGATNDNNSSNLTKLKLVKVLNNPSVICIIASTSWIPTPKSIEWLAPCYQLIWLEHVKWVGSNNCSCKSTLFLSIHAYKHLLHPIVTWGWRAKTIWFESTKIISRRTRTMVWRWSHDLQMRKSFNLSEKWNREKMTERCSHLYSSHP